MSRYIALVDTANGAYGVSFPDAPGCTAMAGTQEAAINDATAALAEWVADQVAAGEPVPSPSVLETLLKLPDVATALHDGAVLAMIPLIVETGRSMRANISLDAGLLAEIDEAARRQGVTRSAFLATAAKDRILAGA